MSLTGQQLGALRMTGLEPERVERAWIAVAGLSAEDRQTLIALLLAELLHPSN